jgi:zinc transporter, ZIP family
MINDYLTIGLSFVIGLSIFLSMPLVFHKKTGPKRMLFFNAIAIGILVFLLLDIYGDVAAIFGNGVITNFSSLEFVFLVAFVLTFLFFIVPKGNMNPERDPKKTSILAALGIGLQNLTEGLVFGSAGAAGLSAIYVLSLIGFSFQNITEGFPIAAPLMGLKEKLDKKFVVGAFLIGGIPTILGAIIGIVYYSNAFIIVFDAMAGAAILYVVLVLFHVNLHKRNEEMGLDNLLWLTYFGILVGFALAFILNYIVLPA